IGPWEWLGARTSEVARGFGYRNLPAFTRVEPAIERIAISGRGQNLVRITDKEDGGVRSRFDQCAGAYGVIVLAIDPVLRGYCRIAKQLMERFVIVDLTRIVVAGIVDPRPRRRRLRFARIQRRFVREWFCGN